MHLFMVLSHDDGYDATEEMRPVVMNGFIVRICHHH